MDKSHHLTKLRRTQMLVGGLLLVCPLMLAAGGAEAQGQTPPCPEPPGNPAAGERVSCKEEADSTEDISIDLDDFDIDTDGQEHHGVAGLHLGTGSIDIDVSGGTITTDKNYSTGVRAAHEGTGGIRIRLTGRASGSGEAYRTIETDGFGAFGVLASHHGVGGVDMDVENATIVTHGTNAYAVHALHAGKGKLSIGVTGGYIETTGDDTLAIYGRRRSGSDSHDLDIRTDGVTIVTRKIRSHGVVGYFFSASSSGDIGIDIREGSIDTEGELSLGVFGWHEGTGGISIDARDADIETDGGGSIGIGGRHDGAGGVSIGVAGGAVATAGADAHGVYALHRHCIWFPNCSTRSSGDTAIDITGKASVTTRGAGSHAIHAGHQSGQGRMTVTVGPGSRVVAAGEGSSGIRIGGFNTDSTDGIPDGTLERVAGFDEDGYRQQTATVRGAVSGGSGEAAGVYLAGGGKVIIGPKGTVSAKSGIAVLAARKLDTDPAPKLLVSLKPGGRRIATVLDGGWIVNDGGETTILVNDVNLHDGATGATGLSAPNGVWDVTVREEGVTVDRSDPANWITSPLSASTAADRDFSADDFNEVRKPLPKIEEEYAPRAAVYEALPGALLRLDDGGHSWKRHYAPGFPAWARISSGRGSFRPSGSRVGARHGFDRHEEAAGLDIPLIGGLTAGFGLRRVSGAVDVSAPTGGGGVEVEGRGLAAELAWRDRAGFHTAVRASVTDYDLDLSSSKRGTLARDVEAAVRAWSVETGRRFGPEDGHGLAVRAWLHRSMASIKSMIDIVGSRFSVVDGHRTAAGASVAKEIRLALGGGRLSLGGSLGVERTFSNGTAVLVAGERLASRGPDTRFLLGLGASWRLGGTTLGAGLSAGGPGSDDRSTSASLTFRITF